jgi:DNA mismatch endonuclease (patch repair protein)
MGEGSYICVLMADVHTKEQRSFNMSRIKSRNTKPEMLVTKNN